MQRIYYPEKLKQEGQKLKERYGKGKCHKALSKKELKELILDIVKHNSEDLDIYKIILKEYQIEAVSKYIQRNIYEVDISNLLKLIVIMDDFHYFDIVYQSWQQDFDIPFENVQLKLLTSHYAGDIQKNYNLNAKQLNSWMTNKDADRLVGKALFYNCASKTELNSVAENVHLDRNKSLFKYIEQDFYSYCSEKAFIATGDAELCYFMKQLTDEKFFGILYHFLDVVSPEHYDSFEGIATYSNDMIGQIDSRKYNDTIGRQTEHIKESYKALMNMYWVLRLFGKDSRSIFWKRYIKDFTVQYFDTHDMLLMDFGRHYITEFKTVGVIYIFEKKYFTNVYRAKMASYKTQLLKSDMRSDDKKLFMQEHRKNWQLKVMNAIDKYNVVGAEKKW